MIDQLHLLDIAPAADRAVRRSITPAPRTEPRPPVMREQGLPIRVGTEVTLVGIESVRAAKGGLDAESVAALVDAGRFRWVWDLATSDSARRRELRWLAIEIIRDKAPTGEAEAVETALGGLSYRQSYRTAEIEQRWIVSNATLLRLGRAGELAFELRGRNKWISRDSLVAFLRRRLIRN
jgi:hypothetical protein